MSALTDRFLTVQDRLSRALKKTGRTDTVQLVAVSKWHAPSVLAELAAFWANEGGQPVFGESYAQEALEKMPQVASATACTPQWHFIGHLQSRKAKEVAGLFSLVHSLDSAKLAKELQKALPKGQTQAALIQVNIGREPQKSGVMPDDLEDLLLALKQYPGITIHGLMGMPPYNEDGEFSRPFFQELRTLRDQMEKKLGIALPHLSMGMSHDMEVAIQEGATIVRVGTDIFGPREY